MVEMPLLRKTPSSTHPSPCEQTIVPTIRASTWPESTFVYEAPNAQHFLGSHWDAFFEDSKTILENLPTIVQSAEPWMGGVNQEAPRQLPDNWPFGFGEGLLQSSSGFNDGHPELVNKMNSKFLSLYDRRRPTFA